MPLQPTKNTNETSTQFGSSLPGGQGSSQGLTIETNMNEDQTISLMEGSNVAQENLEHQGLVAYVKSRFERSKAKRYNDEQRWLTCYRNYRGIYGPDVQFTDTEKSKAFIKITKTKVLAAYAQILDILFTGNKFPLVVEHTSEPDGIAESVHVDPKEQEQQPPEGNPQIPSTTSRQSILEALGPMKQSLSRVQDKLKEGPGLTPTSLTWEPAKIAAKKMTNKIQDQLEESNADSALRRFVFEMCLFGQGVFKGPFAKDKEYAKWNAEGEYQPVIKTVPDVEFVSIWDSYPDADAFNMADAVDFTQRHRMSKTQLRALKKRPFFREESIENAISDGYNYTEEYWENTLRDYTNVSTTERFEVLEYWGIVDSEFPELADMEVPKEFKNRDQVQINAWVCNGHLLRVVFNPFTPAQIPYQSCPYELNPYSFFGIGIAENMLDTQLLMNGFIRLAVDNAALSSNLVIEVNENKLIPGQDMKLYPGKVFRTNSPQGQSIWTNKFENITQECLMMFDKARQLADEATGMPSYSHGQGGIQGIGRTASGMSMLMGAAKENIKSVIRNIDDYLLTPLGKALFAFNMQFNFDSDAIGDLDVKALGTISLMRNEVRSQKILQFLQLSANPIDAPYVKRDYLLRELSESLDIEADKAVNDPREAGIQAMLMQELMKAQGIDPNKPQQGAQGASIPQGGDPTGTGGGNIAPGNAPTPGEQGFSAPNGNPNPSNTQQ